MRQNYLNVPYKDKDIAKSLGAKWDYSKKQWFIPAGVETSCFEKWLPCTTQGLIEENLRSEYFYLAQTEKECFKCHKHTIVNAIVLPEGFESIDEEGLDDDNQETPFCANDYPSVLALTTRRNFTRPEEDCITTL